MTTYRTPGVYVEEVPAFPPSVTEVETAIPAFIGHTGRATRVTEGDLRDQAVKIHSFAEFERYYGAPAAPDIDIALAKTDAVYLASVNAPDTPYILYYAVKMYFDNGGGKCYIVSIGDYENDFDVEAFARGLRVVADEDEPTLLICPEADRLDGTGYDTITQVMLAQCGRLKDRFAIIDLFGGDASTRQDAATLSANRARLGNGNLQYGALYYPHVRSSFNHYVLPDGGNVSVSIDGGAAVTLGALGDASGDALNLTAYDAACKALQHHHVVVPASGAVAGVYAATDAMRGVWKAPANASLADVVEPVVKVENAYQDELNIDVDAGKSINAIRAFAGKGTLVWGARTLAGNDNEWRYVPVRRFFNMVEESVRKSTCWAVFEPNEANTWMKVRGMIENYLTRKWREGALAGATPKDAFFVRCGLGPTMNAQDLLEGRMNMEIGMAVVRPAEFIVLKVSHKLQAG